MDKRAILERCWADGFCKRDVSYVDLEAGDGVTVTAAEQYQYYAAGYAVRMNGRKEGIPFSKAA